MTKLTAAQLQAVRNYIHATIEYQIDRDHSRETCYSYLAMDEANKELEKQLLEGYTDAQTY